MVPGAGHTPGLIGVRFPTAPPYRISDRLASARTSRIQADTVLPAAFAARSIACRSAGRKRIVTTLERPAAFASLGLPFFDFAAIDYL